MGGGPADGKAGPDTDVARPAMLAGTGTAGGGSAGAVSDPPASVVTTSDNAARASAAAPASVVTTGDSAAGASAAPAVAQGDRAVGVVRGGRNALELIGTLVQEGLEITGYGYLTRISGVPDERLFARPALDRGESACRFTFFSRVRVTGRSLRPELSSVVGVGDLAIYFDSEGYGADFLRPESFAGGKRVATYSVRLHNVLTLLGGDRAMATVVGQIEQRSAERFVLFGRRTRLGHAGMRQRLTASGPGRTTDGTAPRSAFQVAGNLVVAG